MHTVWLTLGKILTTSTSGLSTSRSALDSAPASTLMVEVLPQAAGPSSMTPVRICIMEWNWMHRSTSSSAGCKAKHKAGKMSEFKIACLPFNVQYG